ncbi:MAG: CBS domain-containing protein [Dechloromonas sp.]|nr:MAG: CBS domain-containing protein [Dechloromonas sp.]
MNSVTDLRLCDIATHNVLTVAADLSLQQVISAFVEKRVSSIIVVEDDRPVGIVTERDLLRLICSGYDERRAVRSVMSAPLLTARQDLDFATAQSMLANRAIRHLVLVDDAGCLRGVASETDFRRHIGNDLFTAIQSLGAVMEPSAELIAPEFSLATALEIMASRRLDHVLIGRDGVPVGIITERDVPRLLASHVDTAAVTVADVMSAPLQTVAVDINVADAARRMEATGLRHLVVVDAAGRIAGVVSQHRMLERLSVVLMEEGRNWLAGQLDVVLETTGVGTWEFDHGRDVMLRSLALNKVLNFGGDKAEESLAEILERIEPDDRPSIESAFHQQLATAGRFAVEYRVRDGEGRVRWFSTRGRVVERDEAGRPLRSAGVAVDIDAQKTTELDIRRNEQRLRMLMENLPIPLCQLDDKQRFTYINRRFVETFGYQLADVPDATTWFEKAYPDVEYRAWVLEHWQQAVAAAQAREGIVEPDIYRVRCANGDDRTVAISAVAFGQELLGSFVDLTAQKQQQQLLEFSNAVLRRVSSAESMTGVLEFICREIEAQAGGPQCAIMLVDDELRLRTGAGPSLPAEYTRLVDGVKIGPAVGSCGTAAFSGEPVFVADIGSDPLWADFRELAANFGFGACWSSPIKSPQGRVLGTFALYWPEPTASVSPQVAAYVEAATALTAIAIERQRRDARMQHQLDELRRWQRVMLGREGRVLSLKQEVNALLARLGEAPRYAAGGEGEA